MPPSLPPVGIIGLGTMGRNLALNFASRDIPVVVWNREPEWTDAFVAEHGARFTGAATLEAFAAALTRPRRVMLMIPAGSPVDEMIGRLRPLLDEGDVVIDGGKSWFGDSERR